MRTLVVCFGGLDSVALSHKIEVDETLTHLVSFDYGRRHKKELEYARRCATRLGVTHDVIDISDIGRRLTGSVLTDGAAVPEADIVREDARLGVPFAETWSCYWGGVRHCGRCGTCVERREAFHLAGVDDPTAYDDADYWLEVCRAYLAKHPA